MEKSRWIEFKSSFLPLWLLFLVSVRIPIPILISNPNLNPNESKSTSCDFESHTNSKLRLFLERISLKSESKIELIRSSLHRMLPLNWMKRWSYFSGIDIQI